VLKKTIVCLIGLALILGALAFLHVYYISGGAGGTLFWNGNTAYLFLNRDSLGYRMNYLQYIGQTLKEALGVGRPPSEKRYSSVVFTISSSNVNSYVLDGMRLSEYFVINGSVLSGHQNTGILWKWDQDHFVRASSQDQRNLAEAGASSLPGPEYDDLDGWHKRINIFSHKDEYTYVINLNATTLSLRVKRERLDDLSVDLERSDGTNQSIWHLDGHPRKVSKAEYEQIFVTR
jgi:hypothetical protein